MRFLPVLLLTAAASTGAEPLAPLELLRAQEPELFRLFSRSGSFTEPLARYAQSQGFRAPVENLGTVVHELVHIRSATASGFFIRGVVYEPYLNAHAWPRLTNHEVSRRIAPQEMSVITSVYMRNTPANNLGNILDELSAHAQVAPFICRNEPESGNKQVRNILGHLHVQEAYLRVTRQELGSDYRKLLQSRESSGAIYTITQLAWKALERCGVPFSAIPKAEVSYFFSLLPQPAK